MHEKILSIIRLKGPVLPAQLSKILETNSTMAGAYLSELVANKKLLLTHLKIGTSPLYYFSEQKHRLQEFSNYLNEKDKKAFEMLKKKKVLRDKNQDPLMRVALRNIKDFAVPFGIKVNGLTEIFWKWYLMPNDDAKVIMQSYLNQGKKIEPPKETIKKEVEKPIERKIPEIKKEEPKEVIKKIEDKKVKKEEPEIKQKEEVIQQQKLVEIKRREIKKEQEEPKSDFLEQIESFFKNKNIEILSSNVIRKKSEIDLLVRIPNPIGVLEYYCKAKNKKRCNEGDLSSAFVQGQLKKLPILFITTGDLTKKAKLMLDKEFKNNLLFRKIE